MSMRDRRSRSADRGASRRHLGAAGWRPRAGDRRVLSLGIDFRPGLGVWRSARDRSCHPGAGPPVGGDRSSRDGSVSGVHLQGRGAGDGVRQCRLRTGRWAGSAVPRRRLRHVVIHTTLCHIPQPERVLAEAFGRCAREAPWPSATGTTPRSPSPLASPTHWRLHRGCQGCIHQRCMAARRLPGLLRSVGFELGDSRSHGYLQTSQPDYMLTLVDRGADTLASRDRMGPSSPRAEGRGSASGPSRRVLRLHRLRELYLPKARGSDRRTF